MQNNFIQMTFVIAAKHIYEVIPLFGVQVMRRIKIEMHKLIHHVRQ